MSTTNDLPVQDISSEVLIEKYAKGGEQTPDELRERVARALAAAEKPAERAKWTAAFLAAQQRGFVPAGRIMSAALRYSALCASNEAPLRPLKNFRSSVFQSSIRRTACFTSTPAGSSKSSSFKSASPLAWPFGPAAAPVAPTIAGAYLCPKNPGPNAAGLICNCGATLT